MKEKDFEMEQDLFAISKANRRGMIIFLAVMLALWCVPIYSLLKDSLKVHGLENYWYVLTNEVNGVPFYQYFINSIINAVSIIRHRLLHLRTHLKMMKDTPAA